MSSRPLEIKQYMNVPSARTRRLADVCCWATGIRNEPDSPRCWILRNNSLLQAQMVSCKCCIAGKCLRISCNSLKFLLFCFLKSSFSLANSLHKSHDTVVCFFFLIILLLLFFLAWNCPWFLVLSSSYESSQKGTATVLSFTFTLWPI